jgi:hypothetical protein
MGESDRRDYPFAATPVWPEASPPIEIGGSAFHGDRQIGEPERPDHAVPEGMDGENPEVILRRRHADGQLAERDGQRA